MAKILVEFDTVDKKMTASIDGKKVENANEVHFGMDYEGKNCHCSISQIEKDEDNDMWKMTRIMAAESVEHNQALAEKRLCFDSENFSGFVELQNTQLKAAADIAKYFE